MDQLQEKLNAVLSNPEMMNSIMAMAQSLGAGQKQEAPPPLPIDPGMLQRLSSLAGSGSIDPQQKELLQALTPYLSRRRLEKLEHAMRASKMARLAASALSAAPRSMNGR